MPLITYEHLKVYQNYGGDIDGFLRRESESHFLFDEDGTEWGMITSAFQNIELISKKLVSGDFTAHALTELKSNCDDAVYVELTTRIPFYNDFQKIASILSIIKDKISFDTDFVYTSFNTINELENHVDNCIKHLLLCDFETLDIVQLDFGPTSTYQELSMRNGWTDEYLKLAEEFDLLYSAIRSKVVPVNYKPAKPTRESSNIFIKLWLWILCRPS